MHTTGLNFVFKHICFLIVENLFVYNEGLFWLGESCLTYIIFGVALIHQSEEESQKNKEKKVFYHDRSLSKHSPLSYLCISLSPSPTHSQSLSDLLSLSHPLLPHTSHLSLLHSERPIWESASRVWLCACVSSIGAVAHQCLADPLSIFTRVPLAGSQIFRETAPQSLYTWSFIEETGGVYLLKAGTNVAGIGYLR